jgi:hypothetical protein
MQSQAEFQIQPPPGPDAPTDIRFFPGHPFQLAYKGVMLQPVIGIQYETVPARAQTTPPSVLYRIPAYHVQKPVGPDAPIDIRSYPGHPHQIPQNGVMLQPIPGVPYTTISARYTTIAPTERYTDLPSSDPPPDQPRVRTYSTGTVPQLRERQSRSPERRQTIRPIQSPRTEGRQIQSATGQTATQCRQPSPIRGPTPGRNPPPVRPIYEFTQSRAPINSPVRGTYVPMPTTGTVQTRMTSGYTIPTYEQQQREIERIQDNLMEVDDTQAAPDGRTFRKPPPGMPPLHAPHHGVAPPDYPFGPLMQTRPTGARAQRLYDQLAMAQRAERQLTNLPPVQSQLEATRRAAQIAELHETLRTCFDSLAAAQAEEGYGGPEGEDDDPGRPRG